ncbi:MAG: hypothetical protein NC204_05690 [Candidatus Amulumruptor caecigallinarius]|nr:hypothetical protein [Candidatus Amulumruptor caecigallinarius]
MTFIERQKQALAKLEMKRGILLRSGQYGRLQQLDEDLERVRDLIKQAEKEAEERASRPARDLMNDEKILESGLIPAVIESHLAADYLAACCYNIEDIIDNLGYRATSIVPELKKLIKDANDFAAYMLDKNPNLDDLLIEDETLIQALHKKTLNTIKQRLGKKKKGNP